MTEIASAAVNGNRRANRHTRCLCVFCADFREKTPDELCQHAAEDHVYTDNPPGALMPPYREDLPRVTEHTINALENINELWKRARILLGKNPHGTFDALVDLIRKRMYISSFGDSMERSAIELLTSLNEQPLRAAFVGHDDCAAMKVLFKSDPDRLYNNPSDLARRIIIYYGHVLENVRTVQGKQNADIDQDVMKRIAFRVLTEAVTLTNANNAFTYPWVREDDRSQCVAMVSNTLFLQENPSVPKEDYPGKYARHYDKYRIFIPSENRFVPASLAKRDYGLPDIWLRTLLPACADANPHACSIVRPVDVGSFVAEAFEREMVEHQLRKRTPFYHVFRAKSAVPPLA